MVNDGGAETIAEKANAKRRALEDEAKGHAFVQAVFAAFPKAKIKDIRTAEDIAAEAAMDALPEVEDEWDPFEEE